MAIHVVRTGDVLRASAILSAEREGDF